MKQIIYVFVISCISLHVNSQVIFDDEPERQTTQRQIDKIVVITVDPNSKQFNGFGRPQQNFHQSNPNNFGRPQQQQQGFQQGGFGFGNNNNNNNGFGNQGQGTSFSSASASSGGFRQPNQNFQQNQNQQGFFPQNPQNNFQNGQQGFQNQNEVTVVESRSPDCRTYRNTGGYCTPLSACGRIARAISNRPPFVAARILQRSICGFSGIIPNVCCPTGRFQQNLPSPQPQPTFPTKEPSFQNNNNNFGGGSNDNQGFQNDNKNSGKGDVGNNDGGGLVIIPASPPPQPPTTSTTTTTTPVPFEIITKPTKAPGGSGGLIIGDGPIALLKPQQGGSSPAGGFSAEGLPEDCGFSNASHTRIVGGKVAEKGAWPWIAALGYKDTAGNINYLCGGALISPNYVVTASHCLHGRNDLATVRLGDHDLYSTGDGASPMEIEVDKTILHPNYDPNTFKNDIALLHLKKPVPYSRAIHPICLPNTPKLRNQRFENTSPFVAGWGAIQFNGPSSSVLREVQIPTVPDSECQQKFAAFQSAVVDDTNICAGLQRGGKDACQGDSGGPLQQPVGNNKYVLIGIVSFGFKCAEPDFPGIYTRVTSHLDWIQKTISQ